MDLTRCTLMMLCCCWSITVGLPRRPGFVRDYRLVHSEELSQSSSREEVAGYVRRPRIINVAPPGLRKAGNQSSERPVSSETPFLADYDIIEVANNNLTADEVGFLAIPADICALNCIRGLSGFCICPPPDRSTGLTPWPPTPLPPPSPRTVKPTVFRENTIPSRSFQLVGLDRVKRDEEDEEHDRGKLCKCRHCMKLFKRTLYCRVYPCYLKKCKSGEWRE